jgi:hypothetical protein
MYRTRLFRLGCVAVTLMGWLLEMARAGGPTVGGAGGG